MPKLAHEIGNLLTAKSEYLLITNKLTELTFRIKAKYSAVVESLILTSEILQKLHFVCFVSSPIPLLLLTVQRNQAQTEWYHLDLSWCTMASDVKRRGVLESKNIDYVKQHHTSVEHHGVQPTGCMDNEPEPSRGVPC